MGEVDDVQHAEDQSEAHGHQTENAADEQPSHHSLAQNNAVLIHPSDQTGPIDDGQDSQCKDNDADNAQPSPAIFPHNYSPNELAELV